MSGIILPGQQHMTPQQLNALKQAEQKQRFLIAISRWSIFIETDPDKVSETEIGKEILKNIGGFKKNFPEANMDPELVLNKLHQGARQVFVEQEYIRALANKEGKGVSEDQSVAMTAKITCLTEAIVLHDPQVVGTPNFRACLLAFELGFLVPQETEEESEDNLPEIPLL